MNRIVDQAVQERVAEHSAAKNILRDERQHHEPKTLSAPAAGSWVVQMALRRLLKAVGNPPMTLVLWSGEEVRACDGPVVARILVRDRATLWKLATDPLFAFGEAFTAGCLEVEGNLTDFLTAVYKRINSMEAGARRLGRLAWLIRHKRRSTLTAARENIHHHYDLGNDFYKLWLDEQLVYTCAYFADPRMTLEEAQRAKMDHICRKLRLQSGEKVIEAGCGWGAMAMHMARHYGVTVKAYNISHEQIVYAREQARLQGLDGRVEFIEEDWRNIRGRCDAFVSVGMLEHVGLSNYTLLGDVIDRCLEEDGRGLIHTIGQNRPGLLNPWIERRIFPGAYPPALSQIMQVFEPHRFSVLDTENLRLHYALTLRHWLDRYENTVDTVRGMFDEPFVRAWRLYLSGSLAAFESGGLQLFQLLFTREPHNQIPWTRAELYAPAEQATR